MNRRKKGEFFETKAVEFLQNKGYVLLDRNVYLSHGEIDLIMGFEDEIVFVEVKSLKAGTGFSIYESLTRSKISKLRRSILTWINKKNFHSRLWRLDFIGIIYRDEEVLEIEHIVNIEMD